MIKIVTNKILNRIVITLSGSFDGRDIHSAMSDLNFHIEEMRPGFDVITDLRYFKSVDVNTAMKIHKGTDIVIGHGAARIVRVVGGSEIALKMFAKFSDLKKKSVKSYYVATLQQAERILDTPVEQ